MTTIKTVAVVGATGNIGAPAILALRDAGFQVTALTRESSTSTLPSGFTVKRVNFDSFDSVKDAFAGQDAVVSMMSTASTGQQRLMVDTAVSAGVKRFIPSEFGVADYKYALPYPEMANVIQGKLDLLDYLEELSKENPNFTWTRICTGLFFEWALTTGHLRLDKDTKSATLFDSGNETFQLSSYPFIAKAIVAILQRPDVTSNQFLVVASATCTQAKLLKYVEEISGQSWKVKHIDAEDVREAASDEIERDGANAEYRAYSDLLAWFLYGDGKGVNSKPGRTDNKLLGLDEEDPKDTLRGWLAGKI